MFYSINVSLKGRFYFEVNRLSDQASDEINKVAGKLRDDYPVKDGYKVTVSEVRQSSIRTDI